MVAKLGNYLRWAAQDARLTGLASHGPQGHFPVGRSILCG
jgi:hypothetical protein